MTLLVNDPDFQLYVGDVLEQLAGLPDESVHCVVTSPPYWGLRDYGTGAWDGGDPDCDHVAPPVGGPSVTTATFRATEHPDRKTKQYAQTCGKCGATRVDQQLGLEPTPEAFVAAMVDVFREVRRVLRRDGTCWVNLGDSYASVSGSGLQGENGQMATRTVAQVRDGKAAAEMGAPRRPPGVAGLKPKDLCGIPWRVAFALQADGWYLRSDIIWSKPNPMPESVTDRPTKAHEYVFLLTRSPRYFFDQEAVREPATYAGEQLGLVRGTKRRAYANGAVPSGNESMERSYATDALTPAGRNVRSVWEIATQPYPEAHFATFPEALPERCIKAGSSERGCCPECGAPWVREVERTPMVVRPTPKREAWQADDDHARTQVGGTMIEPATSTTTGWRPSCSCWDYLRLVPKPVPCVVLDPFMGSGTTALVARRLGRKSIGVELNPDYAALCARRLQQLSLLA